MTLIASTHLAVTWMLTGLIWVVQILVYPQFLRVPPAGFREYHAAHCFRIGLIVAPLMFVEAATAAWLLFEGNRSLPFLVSTGLIAVVWLSTAMLQAPMHTTLMMGCDSTVIRRLIHTNWLRTLAWTARAALVTAALA